MNVLVYLYAYPPYRYTGGELMTADLLEALVRKGHRVDVFVDHLAGDKPYTRNGVNVSTSAYLHYEMARPYDVFITHPEIRTGAIKYMHTLPYVAIVHNTGILTMRSLERQAPNLTVVNSTDTLQYVPQNAKDVGVVVINPPVLVGPATDGQVMAPPVLPAHHYITMVNLSHEKGGKVLAYLPEHNPTMPFLGVTGGHGAQITDMPGNVTIIGPQEDMRPVYGGTKTLLFPTKRESYGKVAAEAMQWGIPCIVSDLPALHEVCGDAAMFIDPHQYAEWNVALQIMQFDVHDKYAARSKERGALLKQRSLDDLDRWEQLLVGMVG